MMHGRKNIKLIILVFYMFRTSYVHHQEDLIVHAVLYIRLHVHYIT